MVSILMGFLLNFIGNVHCNFSRFIKKLRESVYMNNVINKT